MFNYVILVANYFVCLRFLLHYLYLYKSSKASGVLIKKKCFKYMYTMVIVIKYFLK